MLGAKVSRVTREVDAEELGELDTGEARCPQRNKERVVANTMSKKTIWP
jgi:hypothetical protein